MGIAFIFELELQKQVTIKALRLKGAINFHFLHLLLAQIILVYQRAVVHPPEGRIFADKPSSDRFQSLYCVLKFKDTYEDITRRSSRENAGSSTGMVVGDGVMDLFSTSLRYFMLIPPPTSSEPLVGRGGSLSLSMTPLEFI